jgi:hypothetical protein
MRNLPHFENYMETTSKNYGMNSLKFYTDAGTFWFSYKTLVAFKSPGGPIVCRQNEWGPTTGKHLNAIKEDKKARVNGETFYKIYNETFGVDG